MDNDQPIAQAHDGPTAFHHDIVELVGAFRFCPCCGHPVLAKDDFDVTPEMQIAKGTLEAIELIRCSKCYLPWKSCPCGIPH